MSLFQLTTERLTLRQWTIEDRAVFGEMNADPEVMADQGGPITQADSDRKLDRYIKAFDTFGYGRLAVELPAAEGPPQFIGYVGVMPIRSGHPLGIHDEVGWRFHRSAWGHGYATESATAALHDVFTRADLTQVLSYTAADNLRSQAVMDRLGLRRVESLDFIYDYDGYPRWNGLVWAADKPA